MQIKYMNNKQELVQIFIYMYVEIKKNNKI